MAGAVQKITLSSSRDIRFNKHVLSQSNIRRVKADGLVDPLKAMGLVSEIISWKLGVFVPTGSAGAAMFGALTERFRLVRLTEKAAA